MAHSTHFHTALTVRVVLCRSSSPCECSICHVAPDERTARGVGHSVKLSHSFTQRHARARIHSITHVGHASRACMRLFYGHCCTDFVHVQEKLKCSRRRKKGKKAKKRLRIHQ